MKEQSKYNTYCVVNTCSVNYVENLIHITANQSLIIIGKLDLTSTTKKYLYAIIPSLKVIHKLHIINAFKFFAKTLISSIDS